MKIIWTPRAASDLDGVVDFIAAGNPDAAIRVADRIYKEVMQLAAMPNAGRIGDLPGTRELLFHPWPYPYIAVYKVTSDAIRVIRIRHASQRWP